MKVHATFYKTTGKYYADCIFEMPDMHIWEDGFKQQFVNNQSEMRNGWQGSYYVVIENADADSAFFLHRLFPPNSFYRITKEIEAAQ